MKSTDDLPKSEFGRRLAADPALAAWCEKVADRVRETARKDIEACRDSEIFTAADLGVTFNSHPDALYKY